MIDRYADLAGTALVATIAFAYDAAGRQTGLYHRQGTTALADTGWSYDAAGRLIRETTADGTTSYKYDAAGQLTKVTYADPGRTDESFSYDATGNRTGTGYQTGTGNRLTEDADYTYQYDAEGNRTRKTSKADGSYEAYVWDHRNRLVRVEFKTAANVLTQQVRYDYDAFDNLIRRRVDTNGDGTFEEEQSFVLDVGGKGGLDDVVLTFDGSGNVTNRYLHGPAVDELFADESAVDGLLWALADRQGTVRDWAKRDPGTGTTSVFDHVEFDAYGKFISQTNAGHTITAGGYTGRFHDPLTGLRYHRARWADPATGWISEDPIGFNGGDVNLSRYVGNSPTNGTDPSGLAVARLPEGMRPPWGPGAPWWGAFFEPDPADYICPLGSLPKKGVTVGGKLVGDAIESALEGGARATKAAPTPPLAPALDPTVTTVINVSPETVRLIGTPYGNAFQDASAAALGARAEIQSGARVYKGGALGRSETGASQFLAFESPLNPGYAGRYGVPPANAKFDFILTGCVRPGAPVITRPSPGIPPNPGGGIEGVVNPGDFMITSFYMP